MPFHLKRLPSSPTSELKAQLLSKEQCPKPKKSCSNILRESTWPGCVHHY